MLAVSGRLDRGRPGRHPFPPIEAWHWTQHDAFKTVYPTDHRSVYLMTQRLIKHPFLAIFDGPDTNSSTDVRSQSTVPLQALYFLNNPFVLENAEGLAHRMIAASTDSAGADHLRLPTGLGPAPGPVRARSRAPFRPRGDHEPGSPRDAMRGRGREAWTSLARILLTANEFLYID